MNHSTPDKEMPVITLVNLRLFLGQLDDLCALATQNGMTLDETVSMLVSNSIEDLAHHPEPANVPGEEVDPSPAS